MNLRRFISATKNIAHTFLVLLLLGTAFTDNLKFKNYIFFFYCGLDIIG